MKIEIDIPDPIAFALGEIAEAKDIKIAWLIVHAIRDLLGAESTRLAAARARRERVVSLARQGYTDTAICERTGEGRAYVADNRRRAGIPANRPGRVTTERKSA